MLRVLAQRLVRKLCSECKEKSAPTEKELIIINPIAQSIKKKRGISLDLSGIWRTKKTKEDCEKCGGLGYIGRIGIFEGIITNDSIEKVIVASNPSEREIRKASVDQNILEMREDGLIKVLNGVTSLEELTHIIDLGEE